MRPDLVIGALLCATPLSAQAYSTGIANRAQSGCGGSRCHDGVGPQPTVTIDAPSTAEGGAWVEVQVRVETTAAAVGLDLAAPGQLEGEGLRDMNGELVHASPTPVDDGAVGYLVRWQAPEAGGEITLHAAANAVDLDGSGLGDAWALAAATVSVQPAPEPDAGPEADAGVADAAPMDQGSPTGGGSGDDGGCRAAPGSAPLLGLLALLGLSARRRGSAAPGAGRAGTPR